MTRKLLLVVLSPLLFLWSLSFLFWIQETIANELAIIDQQKEDHPCSQIVPTEEVPWQKLSKQAFSRVAGRAASEWFGTKLLIQVIHANPDVEYSVVAESEGRSVAVGTLVQQTRRKHGNEKVWLFDYCTTIVVPGNYTIRVHEVQANHPHRISQGQDEILGSPLQATVRHAPKSWSERPICQSLAYDALTTWNGDWIGPKENELHAMRTGWAFFPQNCRLEVFSKSEITAARTQATPTTITILGTSVHRGVFLSLADLVLNGQEKDIDMGTTPIHKCWGRMSVQVGNLKFIYQDTRTANMRGDDSRMICHGTRIAGLPGLYTNATKMIQNVFSEEWPSVVLLNSACFNDELTQKRPFQKEDTVCVEMLREWLSVIPQQWDGTIYVADAIFMASVRSLDYFEYRRYTQALRKMNAAVGDRRVRMLDGVGFSSAMRLWDQFPGQIRKSLHYHRTCSLGDGDIRVCSNVTEALAHLLIGRAIAPEGKSEWWSKAKRSLKGEKQLKGEKPPPRKSLPKVCLDCPADLLPFQVKPKPDLVCYKGTLSDVSSKCAPFRSYWDNTPCPAECMIKKSSDKVPTQSGAADVRVCVPGSDNTFFSWVLSLFKKLLPPIFSSG